MVLYGSLLFQYELRFELSNPAPRNFRLLFSLLENAPFVRARPARVAFGCKMPGEVAYCILLLQNPFPNGYLQTVAVSMQPAAHKHPDWIMSSVTHQFGAAVKPVTQQGSGAKFVAHILSSWATKKGRMNDVPSLSV